MRIAWFVAKYLDIALDKPTWMEMQRSLANNDHQVVLVTGYKKKKAKIDSKVNTQYLFSVKMRGLHFLTLTASMAFYSIILLFKWKPDVIICCPLSVLALIPICFSGKSH